MTINASGWRPERPETGTATAPTFTGNKALMLEEPLIFEIGSLDTTGVDFARLAAVAGEQARQPRAHGPDRPSRPLGTRSGAPLHPSRRARITRSTSASSRSARAR